MEWFWSYNYEQIKKPKKFKPAKEFIEYHNDKIFLH